MVFSPSIRQFFFFFYFLGRLERWRCCRAVCVHKRSLPFSASFVSFVCFVLFWLLYVAAPAATYLRNNRREFVYIRSNNRRDLLLFEFCFFAHQRNFPYFRSCGKREKGAIMTVMAEPDSATVDIKPEVSTQYRSSSSSASSLFSHLCIQSINQIVSGGRSRSSEI